MSRLAYVGGQVRAAQNILQLVAIANGIQPTIKDLTDPEKKKEYEKSLDVLRAGIDRLIPSSARVVGSFAVGCNYPDLRHFAIRTYMKKHGIQELEDVEIFLAVLTKDPYPENDIARTLLRDIFIAAKDVLILPCNSTVLDLQQISAKIDNILRELVALKLRRFDHMPALDIFIAEVADAIAQRVEDGFSVDYFLNESIRTASFICNIVVAITQKERVTVETLLTALQTPLFTNDACKEMMLYEPYIGETYDLFLQRFIALVEQEGYDLTLDHLRLVAFNIIVDPDHDDPIVRMREDFVISRAVPLLVNDAEESYAVARSFVSRISAHRFIAAFLRQCKVLTDAQLKHLANCVDKKEPFGAEAAEQVLAAKERFLLDVDVEKVLKSVEDGTTMGLAIIIGGPEGVPGSITFEQMQAFIKKMQDLANPDNTVH